MSKITFRADEELIRQLEEFDASKSEVMREALRSYLDEQNGTSVNAAQTSATADKSPSADDDSLDAMIADRIDAMIADRLQGALPPRQPQDVNVNITLDGDSTAISDDAVDERKTPSTTTENASDTGGDACKQCGETLPSSAVYCANCGEKASHRVFCECGDELRSDWGFCPSCGRRTPAADVLKDP